MPPAKPSSCEEVEKAHIASVLAYSNTLTEAAATLGIDISTLYLKRKRYRLDWTPPRPGERRYPPSPPAPPPATVHWHAPNGPSFGDTINFHYVPAPSVSPEPPGPLPPPPAPPLI